MAGVTSQDLDLLSTDRARALSALVGSALHLVIAAIVLAGLALLAGAAAAPGAGLAWLGLLAIAAAVLPPHLRPMPVWVLWIAVLVGAVGVWAFAAGVPRFGGMPWIEPLLVALPKISVLLLSVVARTAVGSLAVLISAAVLCEAASVLVAMDTGRSYRLDLFALLCALLIAGVGLFSRSPAQQTLPSHHTRVARVRSDEEWRAALTDAEAQTVGVLHDTVLGSLLALAHAPEGRLRTALRDALSSEAQQLSDDSWLAAPPLIDPAEQEEQRRWLSSELFHAIAEWRRRGMEIEIGGQPHAIAGLSAAADQALGLAVRQCLANVHRHAGTDQAEVSISQAESEVVVAVVDDGKGFEVDTVAADRIGLRHSVQRRVEAVGGRVRVWSSPGAGTLVLLRLPMQRPEAQVASPPRSARTLQRLDPVSMLVHLPVAITCATLAVAVPLIALIARGLPFAPAGIAAVLLAAAAATGLILLGTGRLDPEGELPRAALGGLAALAAAVALLDPVGTELFQGLSWGPLSAALLLLGSSAFRTTRLLIVETVAVAGLLGALAATVHPTEGMLPLFAGLFAAYPVLVLGAIGASYSAVAVQAAQRWQHEIGETGNRRQAEYAQSAHRLMLERWRPLLGGRLAPFLARVAAGRSITAKHRAEALGLAQELREALLMLAQDRFLIQLFTELGLVDPAGLARRADPEGRAARFTSAQRTALAVALRVLFADPGVRGHTLHAELFPAGRSETGVLFRVEVDQSTARIGTRNSAPFIALRGHVQGLRWAFERPMLEVTFRFGREAAGGGDDEPGAAGDRR